MNPAITTHRSLPDEAIVQAAADVYLDAFSRPPYGETPEDRTGFVDRVQRYAARDGFRLATAAGDAGLLGIGLAVHAHPGDWYREQLASQLPKAEVERWLGDACLEIVHLAVRPTAEGHGVGTRLLEALVDDPGAPTGVLTVDPRADRARRLYEREGWLVLRDNVRIGESGPVELMGRDL